ncbi:MAG: protein pufQ [Fuscovulum sp.]|nr:protein pufQ [Fuscovulum sp.]
MGGAHHAQRTPRAEFYLYFGLIFLIAIPFAAVAWLVQLAIERRLPVHGPLARAWKDAGSITPEIFRP